MTTRAPIALAVGDPAGIGPEVSVRAALSRASTQPCWLFGSADQLRMHAAALGASERLCVVPSWKDLERTTLAPGEVGVCDVGAVAAHTIAAHRPSAEAGDAQWRALEMAARCVQGRFAGLCALVTGPTSKEAVVMSGRPFTGQTEMLAELDRLRADDVSMLFLGPVLKVALVTTHLAIADLPRAITGARVRRSIQHLAEALLRLRPSAPARIVVAGLNPHAGEHGLFGDEEQVIVAPAIAEFADHALVRSGQLVLSGPSPAEAVFRAAQRGDVDGVIAMFHDQATIASKLLDWGSAVNTTWGLSFLRTSVDHGVAYDAARDGVASSEGMLAALDMAVRLTEERHG